MDLISLWGCSESNVSMRVSRAKVVKLKQKLSEFVRCFLLQFAVVYSLVDVVVCIVFGSEWMTWC
jgi:hypothetical protein